VRANTIYSYGKKEMGFVVIVDENDIVVGMNGYRSKVDSMNMLNIQTIRILVFIIRNSNQVYFRLLSK
jgi:hypothetical protein